nr:hypothetical protein HK105_007420 [Polyrhizophydium stewartii]
MASHRKRVPQRVFVDEPFRLESLRTNVLREQQINKEIYSLESHIELLRDSTARSRQRAASDAPADAAVRQIERDAEQDAADAGQPPPEAPAPARERARSQPHGSAGASDAAEPHALRTSDLYTTMRALPRRFEEPGTHRTPIWNYKVKQQSPMYSTTANQYGQHRPTVHDMPTVFHGQTSKFSEHLNMAGPYRNFSLNI